MTRAFCLDSLRLTRRSQTCKHILLSWQHRNHHSQHVIHQCYYNNHNWQLSKIVIYIMTTLTQWQHYLQFKKKISDNINDILSNINRHAKIFYNKKKRLVCLWLIIPFVLNLSFLAHVSRKWFRSGCESGIHLTLHFLRAVHTTDFQWIRDGNETESGNIINTLFLATFFYIQTQQST